MFISEIDVVKAYDKLKSKSPLFLNSHDKTEKMARVSNQYLYKHKEKFKIQLN